MALHLYLVRHAQAGDKGAIHEADKDRHLTAHGKEEAAKIGRYLQQKNLPPEIILASSSVRTTATANIIAQKFGFTSDHIRLTDSLYECTVEEFMTFIHEIDRSLKAVMMVGHNPTISHLADLLTVNQHLGGLPTAGVVAIRFAVDAWKDITQGAGELEFSVNPSMIEE